MSLTKKTLAAATAAILLGSASVAMAAPSMDADATVYAAASSTADVVGHVTDGTDIAIRSCFGNWCKIAYDGGTGYAYQSLIDLDGFNASPATTN